MCACTVCTCVQHIKLTKLHAVLQSEDLLLLLLQQRSEGFHVFQCELQDHSLLQMAQSLQGANTVSESPLM